MSSGHNKRFLANPIGYMKEVLIVPNGGKFDGRTDSESMTHFLGGTNPALQSHASLYLDLVPVDGGWFSKTTVVRADYWTTPPGGDDQINGGYVPYILEGTVNANPQAMGRLALPPGGVPKFCFTGAVNGCSLILCTDIGAGGKVAVHYPNSTGSTLGYPHLATLGLIHVKSIDYFDTGGGRGLQKSYSGLAIGADTDAASAAQGNAAGWFNGFVFMMMVGGVWQLIGQRMFCVMGQSGQVDASRLGDPFIF